MSVDRDELDPFLARALKEPAAWPTGLQPEPVAARVLYHGIAGCLAGRMASWPREAADPIQRAARLHAIWELRHRQVVGQLTEDFEQAGVRALILKGTALAYDLYAEPAQRIRGDSDVLVDSAGLPKARRILTAQGFARLDLATETEEAVSLEETWALVPPDGTRHLVDLHHHAFNAPILAGMIPFETAWSQARPLNALSPSAKGLPLHFALLLACTHRAKHKVAPYYVDGVLVAGADRLIWLLDIDLLARRLAAEDWACLTFEARRHGVSRICQEALESAARLLGTPLHPDVLKTLAEAPAATAATRYLLSQRLVSRMWADILAARGRQRLRYLRHGLFPSGAHMRAKYHDRPGEPLAILYTRRIAGFVASRMLGRE